MLVEYLEKNSIPSWDWFFKMDKVKKMLNHISSFLDYSMTPSLAEVFNPFVYTSFEDLRVVLVGQDPYHNGEANGLVFSSENVNTCVKNIYSMMERTLQCKTPEHGNFHYWAIQGVLLIPMSLTTKFGKSNAHERIWVPFINCLMEEISNRKKNIVFMLWGKPVQKLKEKIDSKKHYILTTSSPYAMEHGFDKCNHFQLANKYFSKHKLQLIDWILV
jgi:uracil-DNA glycosylase